MLRIKQRVLIGTNDFTEISLHVFYVKACFQKATVLSKDVSCHLCNIHIGENLKFSNVLFISDLMKTIDILGSRMILSRI